MNPRLLLCFPKRQMVEQFSDAAAGRKIQGATVIAYASAWDFV